MLDYACLVACSVSLISMSRNYNSVVSIYNNILIKQIYSHTRDNIAKITLTRLQYLNKHSSCQSVRSSFNAQYLICMRFVLAKFKYII